MTRIVFNPKILRGKPIIRGTRISVDLILELLSRGWSLETVLENYSQLTKNDVLAALEYSATRLRREEVVKI